MDLPWNDRAGRFSALRVAALALALAPALWLAWDAATGGLGAKPMTEAIHRTGHWAVRLLLVTLALSPLRRIGGWGRLISVRRLLGLAAFFYALAHFGLYVIDQKGALGRVAAEIALRPSLALGFGVLLGLAALAATSTDAMIRRLGPSWRRLHRTVYGLTALAILHFFLQSKIDATEAAHMLGLWLLLMGWRLAEVAGARLDAARTLALVALGASAATAALEAAWYGLATGAPWRAVLAANLTPTSPRPALWALLIGIAVALGRGALGRRAAGREATPPIADRVPFRF